MRLLATDRRGNEQQCLRAFRCKLNSQRSLAIASRPSSARRDRQQGNLGVYRPSRWSIPVLREHCSGSVNNVLLGIDPPRRSPSTWEGECLSYPTISPEARPHRHRAQPKVFNMINQRYGPHFVDLFATRDNRLLDRFVSWWPDPSAIAVDAFMFPLKGKNPHCFPPVSCISRLLREVLRQ